MALLEAVYPLVASCKYSLAHRVRRLMIHRPVAIAPHPKPTGLGQCSCNGNKRLQSDRCEAAWKPLQPRGNWKFDGLEHGVLCVVPPAFQSASRLIGHPAFVSESDPRASCATTTRRPFSCCCVQRQGQQSFATLTVATVVSCNHVWHEAR